MKGMKKGKKHNMSEKIESEKDQMNEQQENQVQEETDQQPAEETMESKLAAAEALVAELQDRYLRQAAEFDNYRKRTVKEKAELIKNGSADVMESILPVIDDLERALANTGKSQDFDALKEGLSLIYSKLMRTLEQQGLQKISPKDEPFDTDFHEAIATLPAASEEQKGKVVDCAIDGYRLNDKVLRHAKVAVAQ